MLTFKLILERENSNNKAVCNEMFDLYVDGTKIEISQFFSDLNVPLRPYETRNLTFSGMIDTPYYFVLYD